jgi:hypothetical protein
MTRLAHLSILSLVLALAPATANADGDGGKERAQALLQSGNALLAEGKNEEALARFEAAYEAYPSPSLLLNIGTTLRALGRNAEAANAYARWIRARQNPERLAEVEEVLGELDRLVGGVRVVAIPADAQLAIDGVAVADVDPDVLIRLEPGTHTIAAAKPGFAGKRIDIELAAGEQQTVRLALEAEGETASAAAAVESPSRSPELAGVARDEPERPGRTLRIAGIASAGVGVIALAAGVKFGLDASRLSDELDEEGQRLAESDEPWTDELLAKQDEGESARTKMIVFTAAGAVAIAAGAGLYILGSSKESGGEAALAITPVLGPDAAGWAAVGRF